MFTYEEFELALEAYEKETSSTKSDAFTRLKKEKDFFSDIRNREKMEEQVKEFINIISSMNRDGFASRYVAQAYLLEFCRYLDKDFLFYITDHSTFRELRGAIREFTGSVYETNKRFTQNIALNSVEHLLEDYALLLKFSERGFGNEGKGGQGFFSLWDEGKLW